MESSEKRDLDAAIDAVLASSSAKKLIIAGPGAGKTTLFQKLLEQAPGVVQTRLVLTFIKTLQRDLKRGLGHLASVNTLHGYCQLLLHRSEIIRKGLTSEFRCHPRLTGLIKQDWNWIRAESAPKFVEAMRNLSLGDVHATFYLERMSYYDALDFDSSVYAVVRQLQSDPRLIDRYDLVLIDEFQDFNRLEAELVGLLGSKSDIVIAGDDDQALYSVLRGASWDYIRSHHGGGEYEVFKLPFCMRCPEVVVGAVQDVLEKAVSLGRLSGRITKPFRYCSFVKGEDSERHPQIDLVRTSAQSNRANYFGQYVARIIRSIPSTDFEKAANRHEPCLLVIGSKPYLPQIASYLVEQGLYQEPVARTEDERGYALDLLREKPRSNLGWRIILGLDAPSRAREYVKKAAAEGCALVEIIPDDLKNAIWSEAKERPETEDTDAEENDDAAPSILLTSYEGSKGLSAQYVILAGLHDGELPRNLDDVADLEICKFLVGLTRTKAKCTILCTRRFGAVQKKLSTFVEWINPARLNIIDVTKEFWSESKPPTTLEVY